jgi:septal ring factor EnvC (AmiA/AmiB activator)
MTTKFLEKISIRATRWIGSTQSLVVHTLLFLAAFLLAIFGVALDRVLLVLTTIVSLEAIYLSIFIQMSVNRSDRRLRVVSRDVAEIEKDIDEIQHDVDEIQEDVEGIEKDIDEIQHDVDEIQEDVEGIEKDIDEIQEDVEEIEKDDIEEESDQDKALAEIKIILADLMKKLEQK